MLFYLLDSNMEPWKYISLLAPPVQTTELKDIDVIGLKHTCDNIIRVLSKQSPLHKEGAILSRLIYKYDKKFRNDIGYRNIKKTSTALKKYLIINLLKDVENFVAILLNEDEEFLPTRQMLEYLLSRIITFATLMLRVNVCSKQAAVFYMDRIKRAQSHWMSLMPYALLSRIWSITAVLLQHATSWYSCLWPYHPLLKPKGLNFLPEGCHLPNDLEKLLDLKNMDMFGKFKWSQRKVLAKLDFSDDEDETANILEFSSYINEEKEIEMNDSIQQSNVILQPIEQFPIPHVAKVDYGQAISRDSFKSFNTLSQEKQDESPILNVLKVEEKHSKNIEKSYKILSNFQIKMNNDDHYFAKVTNEKSLKQFLNNEETYRNDGNKKSLTQHLSFMQWVTLKTTLLKICNTVSHNKKIEKKLQKVWKEKCLDYM